MAQKITIDPITRIEGHLRIDVEVDGGAVTNAWSSGQMFRGLEIILQGRDPRDAQHFVQRICGVCTTVHALASVRAVEDALKLEIPLNAQLIRNLVQGIHALQDHIVHFYALSALDWVDVVSALDADPVATQRLAESLSNWPGNSAKRFAAVKAKVKALVESGQLGPFANAYWGHAAMKLPPEANLMAVSHYLEALDYQRKATEALGIIGGKNPHVQNLNVGGVTTAINLNNQATLNMERLYRIRQLVEEVRDFINNVYLVDLAAVGALYAEWLPYGAGVTNYLAAPDMPTDALATTFDLPGGTIMGGDLASVKLFNDFKDPAFRDHVEESIARGWYDGDWQKHPYEEDTKPKPGSFDENGRYTWLKAPRFDGKPMQVGPLSQMLVGYASGHGEIVKRVNGALDLISTIAGVRVGPDALFGTLGRHAARAVRCSLMADLTLKHWDMLVDNVGKGDLEIFNPPTFPKGEQKGMGWHEAPRGLLSHWIVIQDGKIKNYQCVVPSTWNAGPRDAQDQLGPYEASLLANPIADPERPLEVLRTIHSFDPCIACAVHMLDPEGREVMKVKAL
ncbi:nickel-dependent hydrogenase large subunit [Desulfofustis glycolicus]|uniref:Hydrogenase large subunit n=1 Tax=Desulfofustis glycolicus DSM 9705 TaxID=1121409 RepID=A0A1M5VJJ7_9BACT|nr:nickel-dependent hydrogenase large subunit [Desulfofustis glycolicus]MCB2217634.1 nickel-dependent hydrogenase large subunit [Desulfobulbaceae bacterium]SHH75375.1 hydrogenase large subunit [Desulfofustis glycolicus DSM 9705]